MLPQDWHALQTHPDFTCQKHMEVWIYHQSLASIRIHVSHAWQFLTSQDTEGRESAKTAV